MMRSSRKVMEVVEDLEESITVNKDLTKKIKALQCLVEDANVDILHKNDRISTLHRELTALYKSRDEKTAETAQLKVALQELTATHQKLQLNFDTKDQELSRKGEELTQVHKKSMEQGERIKLQGQEINRLRLVEQRFIAVQELTRD